jgi:hypothetical protein
MNDSLKNNHYHGEIIALLDVDYNDNDRSFQKWHSELKGGLSKYEIERKKRTETSRYRKTKAELLKIILLILDNESMVFINELKQGRNSNGKPRKPKYELDIERINEFVHYTIDF